jgi:transketolase
VQPGNTEETGALLRWAVEEADGNVALRLAIGPSPRRIELPAGSAPEMGRGTVLRDGRDAVLLAYGPVMLHEALLASELLGEGEGLGLRIVAMPWLNRFDAEWLAGEVAPYDHVFVLEDHSPVGALGDGLRRVLDGRVIAAFGVDGWPACGTPEEALRFHGLDGASLADRIAARIGVRSTR